MATQMDACIKIQAVWRGCMARAHFLTLLVADLDAEQLNRALRDDAAILIQGWWRSVQSKAERTIYAMAARCMQRFWRGHIGRLAFFVVLEDALAAAEKHKQHTVDLQRYNVAATRVQAGWRGHQERQAYTRAMQAQVTVLREQAAQNLQRLWRGYCGRLEFFGQLDDSLALGQVE